MTFDENCRVDVNTATGSYTVDQTVQNMEQEPITKTTVEYIIVREGDSEPTPSVLTADHKIRYTFPVEGMVRLVRRTITTTDEVLFAKEPAMRRRQSLAPSVAQPAVANITDERAALTDSALTVAHPTQPAEGR